MKRAQVTIFVIMGIVLVVGILIFVFVRVGSPTVEATDQNPQGFLSSCVSDALQGSLQNVLAGGGVIKPTKVINYSFDEAVGTESYRYLCHTADFFEACYVISPMIEQVAEAELAVDTKDEVQSCFEKLARNLEDQGFSVSQSVASHAVDILPGQIDTMITADVTIARGQATQTFNSFTTTTLSPAYALLDLAHTVVAAESTHCYFDYNAYMLLFPEFSIQRIDYEASKIYRVSDRASGQTIKFAVRSCAFPLR